MKNFDEYRNFYENDAPLGISGGSGIKPDWAALPAPKTYKEYAIGKFLGLKVEIPFDAYEPKTFAEHALAVYIGDEEIEDIPATLVPKTTIEIYLAKAIGLGL
jgi:hypothetical protein